MNQPIPALDSPFSDQDAQLIVDAAASAPCQNLDSATQRAHALQRFAVWYKLAAQAVAQTVAERDARVPQIARRKK